MCPKVVEATVERAAMAFRDGATMSDVGWLRACGPLTLANGAVVGQKTWRISACGRAVLAMGGGAASGPNRFCANVLTSVAVTWARAKRCARINLTDRLIWRRGRLGFYHPEGIGRAIRSGIRKYIQGGRWSRFSPDMSRRCPEANAILSGILKRTGDEWSRFMPQSASSGQFRE